MKHNTKLTPEQKVVQAAIKWYHINDHRQAAATLDFLDAVRAFRKSDMQRFRRAGELTLPAVRTKRFESLSKPEQKVMDCICNWYIANLDKFRQVHHTNQLEEAVQALIVHRRKAKQDAIVGFTVFDAKRSEPRELVQWCGRMARKGARYFASCWTGCDRDEFVLASSLPIKSSDAYRENNRSWNL